MATNKTTTKDKASKEVTPKSARILKRPRITEKAAKQASDNSYLFDVAVTATKNEIKKAFVAEYKKTPLKVNIVNVKPKTFWRRNKLGFAKRSKKAYVILPKGTTIEIL